MYLFLIFLNRKVYMHVCTAHENEQECREGPGWGRSQGEGGKGGEMGDSRNTLNSKNKPIGSRELPRSRSRWQGQDHTPLPPTPARSLDLEPEP